jgi:hypothetical protein
MAAFAAVILGGSYVNRKMTLCGLAAASLMLPACATITRGTSQKFNIESSPTAAEVSLSSGQQCITPCQIKLKRKPGFTATVKKTGYQTQTLTVDSKLGGGGAVAGAGNIILGGVIGGIVDGTNGSMNNLTPNPLKVTLVPVAPAPVVAAVPAEASVPAADTAVPASEAAPVAVASPSGGE